MFVVHLGHVPPPPEHPDYGKTPTHPGRWVLNHALAQKRHAGLDVEIVSIEHKATCDFVADVEGVRVHFLRTFHPYRAATGFLLDRWRVARTVRKLNPDVVHAHGTEDAYALAAEWTGRPVVITAQGLMTNILPRLNQPPHMMMRFIECWERRAFRKARDVIAKSEYVEKSLRKRYPHLVLHTIPNTYQEDLDAPIRAFTRPMLVFVGSVSRWKGVDMIAEAMPRICSEVPDVSFQMIGNSSKPGSYEVDLIAQLRETLGNAFVTHGFKAPPDLFGILRSSQVLLAPSVEDMFGNQLIEGLMCGLHAIVADETALAENVRGFGNGTIVPQRDAKALAAAAIQVLRHPPSDADREAARQRIRDFMSPARVAARHKALYAELV